MKPSSNPEFDFDVSSLPALPEARGLFVTGTDTEVGKTLVAGAITRRLRYDGYRVGVFKPAASGCRREREGLVSADAEFLAACAESTEFLADITPVRYAPALAPNVAAERTGRPVDLDAIWRAYARMVERTDVMVVEGVGGLLCPITDDVWVVHIARMMKLPVVIVARAELGTINHTLLTVHAARSAGLDIAGVVINRCSLDPLPGAKGQVQPVPTCDAEIAMLTNRAQIEARGGVKVLAVLPDEPANSVENATIGPDTEFVVAQVDWRKLAGV